MIIFKGSVGDEIILNTGRDLEDALVAAERGFAITRKLPAHARSRILYDLLALMERRGEELAAALMLEGGKAQNIAPGQVTPAQETVSDAAA